VVCGACSGPVSAGFVLAGTLEEPPAPGVGKPPRGRTAGVKVQVSVSGRVICARLCGWSATGTCTGVRTAADGKLTGGRFTAVCPDRWQPPHPAGSHPDGCGTCSEGST
jgi:hypothetical protein